MPCAGVTGRTCLRPKAHYAIQAQIATMASIRDSYERGHDSRYMGIKGCDAWGRAYIAKYYLDKDNNPVKRKKSDPHISCLSNMRIYVSDCSLK